MSQTTIGVYKISNKITGKYYIGYSKDIYQRWYDHRRKLKYGKHPNIILQHSYNKHTLEAFIFEIIHKFDNLEDAKNKELEYLENLEIRSILYNMNYNNSGGYYERTPESNKKISDANKKRIQDKNSFYGKKHTEEQKQKWSEQKLGKSNVKKSKQVTIDNINYNSITEASKKLNVSGDTITKRIKSTESEFDNYKYTNEELIEIPISTKISINNVEYNSVQEASIKLKFNDHYISNRLKSTESEDSEWKILDKKRDKRSNTGKKVKINNIIYNSIKGASIKLNINERLLTKILNSKEPIPVSNKIRVSIDNVFYQSVTEASEQLSININKLIRRLKLDKFKNYMYLPIEYIDAKVMIN